MCRMCRTLRHNVRHIGVRHQVLVVTHSVAWSCDTFFECGSSLVSVALVVYLIWMWMIWFWVRLEAAILVSYSSITRRRHLMMGTPRLDLDWTALRQFNLDHRFHDIFLNNDWSRSNLEKSIRKCLSSAHSTMSLICSYVRRTKRWMSAERKEYDTICNATHSTATYFCGRACDTIASDTKIRHISV